MEEHKVVPDVIERTPCNVLQVEYAGGLRVNLGNVLTPTQVKDAPSVRWMAEPGALYTLVMTDPDAPSRENPTIGEVKHWLVGNIQGDQVNGGDTLVSYRGSGPPKGTGLHRYVFLLYKQASQISFDEPRISATQIEGRLHFKVREFAKKYRLGEPVAGNFYQAEWDPYVDERNAAERQK